MGPMYLAGLPEERCAHDEALGLATTSPADSNFWDTLPLTDFFDFEPDQFLATQHENPTGQHRWEELVQVSHKELSTIPNSETEHCTSKVGEHRAMNPESTKTLTATSAEQSNASVTVPSGTRDQRVQSLEETGQSSAGHPVDPRHPSNELALAESINQVAETTKILSTPPQGAKRKRTSVRLSSRQSKRERLDPFAIDGPLRSDHIASMQASMQDWMAQWFPAISEAHHKSEEIARENKKNLDAANNEIRNLKDKTSILQREKTAWQKEKLALQQEKTAETTKLEQSQKERQKIADDLASIQSVVNRALSSSTTNSLPPLETGKSG